MPVRQNNWEHYGIVQVLANRFSYAEYAKKCASLGVTPKKVLEYAQKVGLLVVAEGLYPGLSPKDAYVKLFEEFSEPYGGASTVQPEPVPSVPVSQVQGSTATAGCGSCGGGKVL